MLLGGMTTRYVVEALEKEMKKSSAALKMSKRPASSVVK